MVEIVILLVLANIAATVGLIAYLYKEKLDLDDVHDRFDELSNSLNVVAEVLTQIPNLVPQFSINQNPFAPRISGRVITAPPSPPGLNFPPTIPVRNSMGLTPKAASLQIVACPSAATAGITRIPRNFLGALRFCFLAICKPSYIITEQGVRV